MAKKVLIISTSADKLGNTDAQTGCWVEELAAPYFEFKEAGFDVDIASIKGGEIPFDEASLNPPYLTKVAEKFVLDDECMKLVTASIKVSDITDASAYDAVFLPGGHGCCYDVPFDAHVIKLLGEMYDAGKVVSAVCHGSGGLVNVKTSAGEPIVKGKKVTGFSNAEEYAVAKEDLIPFLLEDKLKELGGLYEKTETAWAPYAVRDGNLVTGQNPGSSEAVAKLIVETLRG